MIEIDGGLGEGGGQILRTAVSLAGVLGKDVRVYNIRRGRSQPGLRAQHLAGILAAAKMCNAKVVGGEVGSTELVFNPSRLEGGRFRFEIGTAGSITLVLQVLVPIMSYAPGKVEVEITGGTDVKWSPPVDYLTRVVFPVLGKMGYSCRLEVVRRGHYPRGGGLAITVMEQTDRYQALSGLNQGSLVSVRGISHVAGLSRHVAERQSQAALRVLQEGRVSEDRIAIEIQDEGSTAGAGSGIVLAAETAEGAVLGADSLGERGKPAEEVGSESARWLLEEVESGAFLDRHMGDIVVPYMALADGVSEVTVSRVTQHTMTNVKVAELVGGVKFEVEGELGQKGRLRTKGLGVSPSSVSPRQSSVVLHP